MASFRRSEPKAEGRRLSTAGGVPGSPFSQAQILHLMKTEFARARRYGFPVACLLVQVDRLDQLVDMHGAPLRDMVRTELGKLVLEKTRGADHLGLASEDRYLLVLPHTPGDAAERVGERLRGAFQDLEFKVGSQELALHLSIGVSSCEDQETLFFDTMLTQAEAAVEHGVRRGGNRVTLFRKQHVRDLDETGMGDE